MRRLALGVLLAACGDNATPPPTCDGERVCGAHMRDAEGRAVIQRGVNLAGAHKLPPYTDEFTRADYARLHAWGFRTLRFLILWEAIEPVRGEYDDTYLAWVKERMQWAADAGLTVVLDMHQDVYGGGFGFGGAPLWTCDQAHYDAFEPQDNWILNYTSDHVIACYDNLYVEHVANFAAAWGHAAQYLADSSAIIGFDPMNEPHWGSYPIAMFEQDRLTPFYAAAITAVRAHAPQWIVFAEPAASRNLGFTTRLDPFTIPDVVYAPHMYDPSAELNGGFAESNRTALLATAEDLRADAERLGLPLWIGEHGGRGSSATIGAYMDAAYDGIAENLASSILWSYDKSNGGYGLLDTTGAVVTPLVDAVVRPYPARIAEPTAWSYADATRTLDVAWTPRAITAPTLIVTPARVYPDGVTVETDGTSAIVDGDVAITGGTYARISPR